MSNNPFFTVDKISKSFGGLQALKELSFHVNKGEIYSVIGPNGAGKSTLFNCINGIYKPDTGSVKIQGQEITGLRPDQVAAHKISRTFQNIELFSNMTTMDNILLGRHMHMKTGVFSASAMLWKNSFSAKDETEHRRKVDEIIDFLDLQASRNKLVSQLPYGIQKIAELGRALATEPELLLLDEPAAGLTNEEREDLIFWIRDIRDELGITIILIEHNIQMVSEISDRIIAINFGKKLVEGTVQEVTNNPDVVRAYLGAD